MSHASASPAGGRRTRTLKTLLMWSAVGFALAGAAPVLAAGKSDDKGSSQPPVLLNADTVTFEEDTGIVTARGNVELSQGQRTVRADTVSYNRNTHFVSASGHVRMVEPSGDIIFSDYVELTDDLKDAFIDNVRVLMTDNARMAGSEGERQAERTTRINQGVYSPCNLCESDPSFPPLWQVKAVQIVHDREKKEVRYKDARLELFGVPIAYTPYLAHPDPTVKRRSGLLAPTYGNRPEMGFYVTGTYYADIAPDKDATISVSPFSKGSALVNGEYRQKFESGDLMLSGALTRAQLPSPATKEEKGERWRGRIIGSGLFDIDDTWRWGFNVNRASDVRFPKNFLGDASDILTSRAFVEGFRNRNYASVTGYSFQDLRYGNPTKEPLVGPQATWSVVGDPGSLFGGRWGLDTGVLSIYRTGGPNTLRTTIDPNWTREFVSNTGLVTTVHSHVLMAAYQANQYARPDIVDASKGDTDRYRLYPEADITVRYPIVHYGTGYSHVIEPIAQIVSAANVSNTLKVPNEDSIDFELDDTNLFEPSRYTGIDRLEGGTHATYGLRSTLRDDKGRSLGVFLGQSYRLSGRDDFPIASGLDTRLSDIVGRVDVAYKSWFAAGYGFRLNKDGFSPQRQTAGASVGSDRLRVSASYTLVNHLVDPNGADRARTEQWAGTVSGRIDSNWRFTISHQQALWNDPGPRITSGILTYQDECFQLDTVLSRDYTQVNTGNDKGVSAFVRLVFKNLGEISTPSVSLRQTSSSSSQRN